MLISLTCIFLVAEGPMLLSRVTAHKITNFRCKNLTMMGMGDGDDDNEDGATTTTMTTTMTSAQRATGYNDDGGGRRRQRGRLQWRDGR